MNASYLTKIVVIFAALIVAGIFLIVFGMSANQEILRGVLPLVGVGMFTSGLTIFLIEMVRLPDHR